MRHFLLAAMFCSLLTLSASAQPPMTGWQQPDKEILDVLHSQQFPHVWASPAGDYLVIADRVLYPPLSELAGPMHKLAGLRVNPVINGHHGKHGGTSPRLVRVTDGHTTPLNLPEDSELYEIDWTVDGEYFALTVIETDHIGLWVGKVGETLEKVNNLALNPLLGSPVTWLPDQKRLLVRRIPKRGAPPEPPTAPIGPEIRESSGASARSTYEARNLLETAHDDKLFTYYMTCELVVLDPKKKKTTLLGRAAPYSMASYSPDGKYILVERLVGPWSHQVGYWRFASEVEVWTAKGKVVADIVSLPVADNVPVHGVPLGPRSMSWRATAPHTLFWIEALDGGDPVAEAEHRDRLMRLEAPFTGTAEELFKTEHRLLSGKAWGEQGGMLMITERERLKRWRYVWLLDVDKGTARKWYDLNEGDRYGNPGSPLMRPLPNGRWVLHQKGNGIYFSGSGATKTGDRPFLDIKSLENGESDRLFRCEPDRYEYFVGFAKDDDSFIMRSESPSDPPNYYKATLGKSVEAEDGEATRELKRKAITTIKDPSPQLRAIQKRIVRYKRNDGVPLSFQLHLPPGYKEGTKLPTVVYAYPREYSNAAVAGQVRGSAQRFMRIYSTSHLFFLLGGYAVLDQTTMPMVGDPENTYDTFIPQLVAGAEAAVTKAVELGVTDPNRIGVIGHSHGGLMAANLLAHTDLFTAGIARSGSYNKTTQPFGFQSERRSLFDARDVYIQVSPTFFADKVNEPILIIHGNDDANPGTLTFQSEVFYEAVRGAGGTARLVLLPFEDHGYRARESVEHVLWEQLEWFDRHVKNK